MDPGTRIGEYEIVGEIGRGGMGQVFKARHRLMKRLVAIKVVARELRNDQQVISRFRREIEAPARISHPNVLTVFDAGFSDDGEPFLASEYLAGGDIGQRVKSEHGQLSADAATSLILQAATGLREVHRAGIVHRDVKPFNLLLDSRGTLRIIDFGLAKFLGDQRAQHEGDDADQAARDAAGSGCQGESQADSRPNIDGRILLPHSLQQAFEGSGQTLWIDRVMSAHALETVAPRWELDDDRVSDDGSLTPLGGALGTPGFMSPEQVRDGRDVDVRSDVYGLGATLYYLLVGQPMFEPRDIRAYTALLMNSEPPSLTDHRDDVPLDLDIVYKKMVSKKPQDRFQSMDETLAALRTVGAKPSIFISYRREDTIDATDRLYSSLRRRFGHESLFLDVDTIPPGVDFRIHLRAAVNKCDIMLVVIGDHWLSPRLENPADFVRLEIEFALELGIQIIPVLVGMACMPSATAVPSSLEAFVFRNAVEVRAGANYESHVDRLADGVLSLWNATRKRSV